MSQFLKKSNCTGIWHDEKCQFASFYISSSLDNHPDEIISILATKTYIKHLTNYRGMNRKMSQPLLVSSSSFPGVTTVFCTTHDIEVHIEIRSKISSK